MSQTLPLTVDPDRGSLFVGTGRYLLIRPETLGPLVSSASDEVRAALIEGGRAGGRLAARAVLDRGGEGKGAVEEILAFGALIGWGRFRVVWGPGGAEVRLAGSPFAEAAGRAAGPVCHLVRGVLEGIWEEVFGPTVAFDETGCVACGADTCRFEERRG